MHLVVPETMREMDRRTIDDIGISGPILMDRAARGAVDALLEHFSLPAEASVGIVCGTGNNGGDGLAMATMLAHRGYRPHVVVLGGRERLSDDARLYFDVARRTVDHLSVADDEEALVQWFEDQPRCQVWCDALLGTGLDRPVEGRYARAIDELRRRCSPVMAVDIPSGLHGRTGQILGAAARAELTASFGFAKLGQCLDPARMYCGRLVVVDIGIPDAVRQEVGVEAEGLDADWLGRHLPPRPDDIHKGDAGRTLHVGGRAETAGAIALSARGALVGGAGLITVATDRRSQANIPTATPEVMSRGLFDFANQTFDEQALTEAVEAADTVVIGPGLGTDEIAQRIVECVLAAAPDRIVADADALNLIATRADIADRAAEIAGATDLILTPHPGEMSRLIDASVDEVVSDPVASARRLSDFFQATVVLKTAATVIAGPGKQLAINRTGNSGMATGGMGDALTGLIAAALADFDDAPHCAACAAVAVHGLAGDRAVRTTGRRGLTVERLLDEVPAVWQSLQG